MNTRFDLYAVIHKGLRAFMSQTLTRVGRADWDEQDDRDAVLGQVRDLLNACAAHLEHEDDFIHPAMEARRPGSTTQTSSDHRGHERHIEEIGRLAQRVRQCDDGARQTAGDALYRAMAQFVAENFEHMEVEERYNNAVLWGAYTDEELLAIEQRLVAAVKPQTMQLLLPWMLPYASPGQRLAMLGGMQQGMPSEAFGGVLHMLRDLLLPREWNKLTTGLNLPACG